MPAPGVCSLQPGETAVDIDAIDRSARALAELIDPCGLCPRRCGSRRKSGETGFCGIDDRIVVASHGPHFGEEEPLVGFHGSGTIFFSGCNLGCIFCQNYDISHLGAGRPVSPAELAGTMLSLERSGCHNINLVTPTHQVPGIVEAVGAAARGGLGVPIVYNCGGYESVEVLKLLDGIVDIYMPDAKYSDGEVSSALSSAPDYPEMMFDALREMHRQVGDLETDGRGIATRGLLVRHLVLPGGLAGTERVMEFIAGELSTDTYVNIMAQYRPCYRAGEEPRLMRGITMEEFSEALAIAGSHGLHRGFHA
ncbi:MAG: radical SAM protein [Candidatus Tritonobacter lacicola]|nr:radical SAM protein [Candidatus Tritonobacter lacicola]